MSETTTPSNTNASGAETQNADPRAQTQNANPAGHQGRGARGEAVKPSDKPALNGTQKPTETQTQTQTEKKEAERRKYKLKVDGKEFEEELDDTEISTRLQKAHAAEKRMAEAAKLRKQFFEAQQYAKQGHTHAAEAIREVFGIDPAEFAEKLLADKYKESTLTEEEKARQAEKKELEKYKNQEKQRQEQEKSQAKRQFEDKIWQETEKEIFDALSQGGFPKDKRMLALVADVADAALEFGVELTPAQMVQEVNKRLQGTVKHVIPTLKGTRILEFLGPEAVNEVLKAEIERRGLGQSQNTRPVTEEKPRTAPTEQKISPAEWRRRQRLGILD